jgi:hypothetical protein
MGGYLNYGKRTIWLRHLSYFHSFLAVPNCRNMAKDITIPDNIQYLWRLWSTGMKYKCIQPNLQKQGSIDNIPEIT